MINNKKKKKDQLEFLDVILAAILVLIIFSLAGCDNIPDKLISIQRVLPSTQAVKNKLIAAGSQIEAVCGDIENFVTVQPGLGSVVVLNF